MNLSLLRHLNRTQTPNAYYRVSVKAKIRQGEKIVLVKEDAKIWDLPGGGVEHDESIIDALRRELKEEIGLTDFRVKNSPILFKMLDESANRPLLFIAYEIDLAPDEKLAPADNVTIGLFDTANIPATVAYSDDYVAYIKQK